MSVMLYIDHKKEYFILIFITYSHYYSQWSFIEQYCDRFAICFLLSRVASIPPSTFIPNFVWSGLIFFFILSFFLSLVITEVDKCWSLICIYFWVLKFRWMDQMSVLLSRVEVGSFRYCRSTCDLFDFVTGSIYIHTVHMLILFCL